jgi:hypothetical protein
MPLKATTPRLKWSVSLDALWKVSGFCDASSSLLNGPTLADPTIPTFVCSADTSVVVKSMNVHMNTTKMRGVPFLHR